MAGTTDAVERTVPTATGPARIVAAGRWLLRPATEPVPGGLASTATLVRLLVGIMWLHNAAWKVPPHFGEADRSGLFVFTSYAVSHPVFPPFSWVVEHLVLPQFVAFGWAVLIVETILAVLLLSGSFIRIAATLGVAQSVAIGLSVARAPHEWPWSYVLMVAVHLLLLFAGAGRYLAVDALRADRAEGLGLSRFWGVLSTLMGFAAIVISATDNPFGPSGANLQLTGLEFSLGSYNVAGGLALVVAGVAILAWSLIRGWGTRRWLAWAAGAISAAAGVLLTVQIGFSPPVLGGTATSAAFFLTLAVVAAALARRSSTRHHGTDRPVPG
jgi:uncharacterized membrane protein YphA (DoxX/SURF4 family)